VHGAHYEDILEIIKKELASGREPKDIAVLCRRHITLDRLSERLREADVPHKNVGSDGTVAKSAELRAIKGYLRLGVNPSDRRAFMAIMAAERLKTVDILAVRRKAMEMGCSLAQAYDKKIPTELDAIREHLSGVDKNTDYSEAFRYIQEVMFYEGITEIPDLVRYLAMESAQDRLRSVKDEVTLMTIHAAKGTEYPVVILIGMNAKSFPSQRSIKEGRMNEERNLAFVAFTRAEEKLILCSSAIEEDAEDGPSRFFMEAEV